MEYTKQNFVKGAKLQASQLNYIENGIVDLYTMNAIGNHCLNKPYNFNGKKAYFFGDSITVGVGDDSGAGGFPKRFSEKAGLSYVNYGVSASTITQNVVRGATTYPSITDKIISAPKDADFFFIAGGINDWQLAVDLTTFKTAVTTLCEYLKDKCQGKEVIFITPINIWGRSPMTTPQPNDPQAYRDIITEVALINGFSVLQGTLFNIPTINCTASFGQAAIADKIHPTKIGYDIYAKSMCTALL